MTIKKEKKRRKKRQSTKLVIIYVLININILYDKKNWSSENGFGNMEWGKMNNITELK